MVKENTFKNKKCGKRQKFKIPQSPKAIIGTMYTLKLELESGMYITLDFF